jgi:hypothetical protein
MPLLQRLQTHPQTNQRLERPSREKQKGQEKEKRLSFFALLLSSSYN